MADMGTLKKVARISKVIGFTRLCYFFNRNRKRVIAYHNVIPDKFFDDSLHLAHSMRESSFKVQLDVMRRRFKVSTDIEDVKSLTITFDDGYLNQYEIASKAMDRYNLKGYFFCVDDLISKGDPILMDRLQYWVSYVDEGTYKLEELNVTLELKNKESRKLQWNKISNLLNSGVTQEKVEEEFEKAFSFKNIKGPKAKFLKLRFAPISKSTLKTMKENGHFIGAHSAHHRRLSLMSEEKLNEDVDICKNSSGATFNTNVFAYPYGSKEDISSTVVELIEKAGFTEAFAYSNGPLKGAFQYNKYFMPRMFLADTSDKDLIDFTLSGAKHFIAFRRLLPKWS